MAGGGEVVHLPGSCFSSADKGGTVALWSSSEDGSYKRNDSLQVFPYTTTNRISSLSWNNTNTLLSCSLTNGDHIAVLNCDEDKRLAVTTQIEPKSLLEMGVASDVGGVTSCCFLGNGHQLLIGMTSPIVSLWDIDTQSVVRNYVGHSSGITCLTRNTKDNYVVSGLENGSLSVHKVSSSQPVTQFTNEGHNESIVCVRFSPFEHSMIGSCDNRGIVKLWSVESQRLLTTFPIVHSGGANDIAFSTYNRLLMGSVGQDKLIQLYDLIQRKIVTQVSCPVPMSSLLLLKDGVTMIGGGSDGNLYFYNLRNCKESSQVISAAHNKPITSLAAHNTIKTKPGRKLPSRSQKKKVTIDPSVSVLTTHDTSEVTASTPSTTSNNRSTPGTVTPPTTLSDHVSIKETPVHLLPISSSLGGSVFSPLDTSHVTTRPHLLTSSQSSPFGTSSLQQSSVGTIFPIDSTIKVNPIQSNLLVSSTLPSQLHHKVQSTPANRKTGRVSPKKGGTPPRSPVHTHSLATTLSSAHLLVAPPTTTIMSPAHSLATPPTTMSSTHSPTAPPTTAHSLATPPTTAHSLATPPTTLQIQYMENMLKDQQDDIVWSLHLDIVNLSVTMLRQFATLENKMILSLTAISEKIDKVSEEMESLKLQVQHLTPKY